MNEAPSAFLDHLPDAYLEFAQEEDMALTRVKDARTESEKALYEALHSVMIALGLPSRKELQQQGVTEWRYAIETFFDPHDDYFDQYNYDPCQKPNDRIEVPDVKDLHKCIVVALDDPLIHAVRAKIIVEEGSEGNIGKSFGKCTKVYLGGKIVDSREIDVAKIVGITRSGQIEEAQNSGRPLIYDRQGRPRCFKENSAHVFLMDPRFYDAQGSYFSEEPEKQDLNPQNY